MNRRDVIARLFEVLFPRAHAEGEVQGTWRKLSPQEIELAMLQERQAAEEERVMIAQVPIEPLQQEFVTMPEPKREAVIQNAPKWKAMPAKERKRIRTQFARFEKLPPPRQTVLERRFEKFKALAANEQEALIRKYRG